MWVVGNIEVDNSPTVKLRFVWREQCGGNSTIILPTGTTSKIELGNSTNFKIPNGRFLFLFVSQNNSAQGGGSEKAITAENSMSGEVLVYAGHGEVHRKNSVSLREALAYKIRLGNSAQVIYKTGLANFAFHFHQSGGIP